MSELPTVAAFDVDGTLTTRDCVVPFMRRIAGARLIVPRLGFRPDRLVPVVIGRDRDKLKALAAAAAFRGRRYDELCAAGTSFADMVHDRWLRSDTLESLQRHREAGDRTVLVSASFEVYVRPLAALLGVDHVLATRLDVCDGIATGALDGPNCRGPEKVTRLHDWLGDRSAVRIVAYGDSAGDREMLADADEAHWVTGDGTAA
jgi:phosphatidylglycerophosphatase C